MQSADRVWTALLAASRTARSASAGGRAFAIGEDGELRERDRDAPDAGLFWAPDRGWTVRGETDPRFELYLPLCAARAGHPMTIGHIGQSLDGFIATRTGESRFVTCEQNIVHLHRLRALCDAVVVGASTVAADNPMLTTRLVPGPNPLRVVIDPHRRLDEDRRVFSDGAAPTLLVCAADRAQAGARCGKAEVVGLPVLDGRLDLAALLAHLHARGCHAVFIEGGGVTVSAFLEAGLLDRLHVAIAPVVIGDGRPALRVPPAARLADARRPANRVYRLGEDVLFDCDLRAAPPDGDRPTGLYRVP